MRIADGSAATTDLTMRETTDFSDGNSSSGSFCALIRRGGAGSCSSSISSTSTSGSLGGLDARLLVVEVECLVGLGRPVRLSLELHMGFDLGASVLRAGNTLAGEVAEVDVRGRQLDPIGVELLDVAGIEGDFLVDDDLGGLGVVAGVAGAGLFGDTILDRHHRRLVVVPVRLPLARQPVDARHLLAKSALGEHRGGLRCNHRAPLLCTKLL